MDSYLLGATLLLLTNIATYDIAQYNAYEKIYHGQVVCAKRTHGDLLICRPTKEKPE